MIKGIISMLHLLKLLLFTQERFGHIWLFSLPLSTCSNYFLVKDIFHLYYSLTLKDARKHLLKREKTSHLILYIFMNLIVIGGYFYKVPQELILLLFTFLVIFFHRLFYKPSLTESENLIIDNDLSLGYGSALCYYDNYLNYILRHPHVDLKHRIRMFKSRHSIKNMSDKLFILIPSSCKVETYVDEFDCINRCKELIPVEINIAGISKRTFNISVYHIICDDDVQNSVRLALEYAQPLKVLFSLKEKGLLSIEDMHKQREIFTKRLKKKLSDSGSSELVHLIEYDDFPSQELFEVLLKVEAVHEFRKYKS